jgi:antitoxin ParD1/3/4
MGTRNISLPKEMEDYISAKVASGEYAHASEVVRDGVRLLMDQEAERLAWLRTAIAEGVASARHDKLISSEDIVREVKALGRARLKARRRIR